MKKKKLARLAALEIAKAVVWKELHNPTGLTQERSYVDSAELQMALHEICAMLDAKHRNALGSTSHDQYSQFRVSKGLKGYWF